MLSRAFIWLSGADPDLIGRCSNLQRTERLRFGGLGALVLVPAVLGACSMGYAASTVIGDVRIAVAIGVLWGSVVAAIDRYLISTAYKSSLGSRGGRIGSLVARYTFAVLVGVAVSHPLVLLWFDDSIAEQLARDRRTELEAERDAGAAEKAALPAIPGPAGSEELTAQIETRTTFRDCLIQLQTMEQSGVAGGLPCGTSSGEIDCGPRCDTIGEQVAVVTEELEGLQAQLAEQGEAATGEVAAAVLRRQAELTAIDDRVDEAVASLESTASTDYLARVGALHELARTRPEVDVVTWFLILFFVFVDVLPVTMKVTTPKGEYEELRDSMLLDVAIREDVRRRVSASGVAHEVPLQVQAHQEAVRSEIRAMGRSTSEAQAAFTEQLVALERAQRAGRAAARHDPELAAAVEREGIVLRDVLLSGWSRVTSALKRQMEGA